MTLKCFFESYFNLIYNSNPERPNSVGDFKMVTVKNWSPTNLSTT